MKFYEDDIAIVSYSAVFPGCEDEQEFFSRLLNKECLIKDLTKGEEKQPLQISYHYSADKKESDATYCKFGSRILLEQIEAWAKQNQLNGESATTTEIILHELFRRVAGKHQEKIKGLRKECILAMSTGEPDPIRLSQRILFSRMNAAGELAPEDRQVIEDYFSVSADFPKRDKILHKDICSSLVFESVRDKYDISGPCSFVDAACASSLAAFMVAIRRLQTHQIDLVFSGGVDVGISLVTLVAFSKLQILSQKIMNPFDKSADGINQGEGAALFALMRIKDAKEKGFDVLGVMRNCDGSSDGALGGMVEPTEYGQNLAYERAYHEVPMYPLSYLECHGTGTKLGDQTELASTGKFFHPLPLIGSVKANLGHTISVAGSASLVKTLKIIEKRKIPPMPHFKKMNSGWPHQINKEVVVLAEETIRVGISSFGFGGANFHMVVDEYRGETLQVHGKNKAKEFKLLINGSAEIDLDFVNELFAASKHKIPPLSLPYADPAVLGGILVVEKLMDQMGVKLSQKQKEKIGVISATNPYLEKMTECYERLCYLEIIRRVKDKGARERLSAKYLQRTQKITEDTFMWSLSNLIAGRVTKDFDLKGPNFNITSEKAGEGVSFAYVKALLQNQTGAYIIIGMDEEPKTEEFGLLRTKIRAHFVSDLTFSLENDLPIEREVQDVQIRRQGEQIASI